MKKAGIKKWYAVRTKPRCEKKTADLLLKKDIEVFFPCREIQKQWSDRKKWITEPLINSYLFVYIHEKSFHIIQYTEGISGFVKFSGLPASIPEDQINSLKLLINNKLDIEVSNDIFLKGEKIEINSGNFKGFSGEIINHRGKKRAMVHLNIIDKVIIVDIPLNQIKKQNQLMITV